jgi:hypothetical protein
MFAIANGQILIRQILPMHCKTATPSVGMVQHTRQRKSKVHSEMYSPKTVNIEHKKQNTNAKSKTNKQNKEKKQNKTKTNKQKKNKIKKK